MTQFQTDVAKGIIVTPAPHNAGQVNSIRVAVVVAATLALNDVIEALILPAGCVPVDFIVDGDDIDSGGSPALTFDMGLMSGDPGVLDAARTVGTEIFSGATIGQAAGVVRPSAVSAYRISRSDKDRSIGLKVKTAAATPAGGTIGITMLYSA